jgi:coenzyme F420-reducing hydrogenase delta subunit
MKKEISNVSLKFPCREKWSDMKIVDGQRHCDTCSHQVVDFRGMTNEQYQQYVRTHTHVCGIFKTSQLSKSFMRYAAATLLATTAFTTTSCDTAETPPAAKKEITESPQALTGIVIPPPPVVGQLPVDEPLIAPIDTVVIEDYTLGIPQIAEQDSVPVDTTHFNTGRINRPIKTIP